MPSRYQKEIKGENRGISFPPREIIRKKVYKSVYSLYFQVIFSNFFIEGGTAYLEDLAGLGFVSIR